jgi:hypothetical protein
MCYKRLTSTKIYDIIDYVDEEKVKKTFSFTIKTKNYNLLEELIHG